MARPYNPNHHLFDNNGVWFVHYTVYPTPITKERVRRSLRTRCVVEARARRDVLLRQLVAAQLLGTKFQLPEVGDVTQAPSGLEPVR
jgi:hypothetical protein